MEMLWRLGQGLAARVGLLFGYQLIAGMKISNSCLKQRNHIQKNLVYSALVEVASCTAHQPQCYGFLVLFHYAIIVSGLTVHSIKLSSGNDQVTEGKEFTTCNSSIGEPTRSHKLSSGILPLRTCAVAMRTCSSKSSEEKKKKTLRGSVIKILNTVYRRHHVARSLWTVHVIDGHKLLTRV